MEDVLKPISVVYRRFCKEGEKLFKDVCKVNIYGVVKLFGGEYQEASVSREDLKRIIFLSTQAENIKERTGQYPIFTDSTGFLEVTVGQRIFEV
mgnify:CR=1 FL=1